MRFIHLADLHIGKKVNEFSMIEDQEYILEEILKIIKAEGVEGVIIAGDVYDRSVPPIEAVQLLDKFLTSLAKMKLDTFVIGGNHDSLERVSFGGEIFKESKIYVSPVLSETLSRIVLNDSFGVINIYSLPFIKPANVRKIYPDAEIKSSNQAVKVVIDNLNINEEERNILIAHQHVTGSITCDSEEIFIGGTSNVDVGNFNKFDYVALGHLHGPQKRMREGVRYSGSPLKYSFSEVPHNKSVVILDVNGKGNIETKLVPLIPKRDMRIITGTYSELMAREYYSENNVEDYIHVILKDEEEILDGLSKLRSVYTNILRLDYDNARTRENRKMNDVVDVDNKSHLELLEEFFQTQNNQSMNKEQLNYAMGIFEKQGESK